MGGDYEVLHLGSLTSRSNVNYVCKLLSELYTFYVVFLMDVLLVQFIHGVLYFFFQRCYGVVSRSIIYLLLYLVRSWGHITYTEKIKQLIALKVFQ